MCLVGHLEDGVWAYLEKDLLSLLNANRLKEIVINHRLLSTHVQPLEKLDPL